MPDVRRAKQILGYAQKNYDGMYELDEEDMQVIKDVIESEYNFEYPEDEDESVDIPEDWEVF